MFEGNFSNITQTIPIDKSVKPSVIEHVHLGENYSPSEVEIYTDLFKEFCDASAWIYEEMLGINPSIIVHDIKTYPDAKPV